MTRLTDEQLQALIKALNAYPDQSYAAGAVLPLASEVMESREAIGNAHLGIAVHAHKAALAAKDARIAELEVALKPFRNVARQLDDYNPSPLPDDATAPVGQVFTMGEFRIAAATKFGDGRI
jgi:hypothetical protein